MKQIDRANLDPAQHTPDTVPPTATTVELQQAIARVSARYLAELRTLSGETDAAPAQATRLTATHSPRPGRAWGRRAAMFLLLASIGLVLGAGLALLSLRRAEPVLSQPTPAAIAAVAPTPPVRQASVVSSATLPIAAAQPSIPVVTTPLSPSPTAPVAVATVMPTLAPTTPPSPIVALSANRQRVAAVELALQSGQFEVSIDYGGGNRSAVQVLFDLGSTKQPRRLHIVSSYQASSGGQTFEQVAIGDQTWQRQPGGGWGLAPTQDGMWEQLLAYLPKIAAAPEPRVIFSGAQTVFSWYDAASDMDIALFVDTATAVPQLLQGRTRATALEIVVTYRGWNLPVLIEPPAVR